MKLRLLGPAIDVAETVDVLRGCPRLRLASVSDPLPTRGGLSCDPASRWVRIYIEAGIRSQTGPCHGTSNVIWVGETTGAAGRVDLWTCIRCAATWTTPARPKETR
jgi:hypothetical protein